MLYDKQTGSLWMHLTGECIEGELAGTFLERFPSGRHTTWADWLALHPESDVMEQDPRWMDRPGDSGYFSVDTSRSGDVFLPRTFVPTIQTIDARLRSNDLLYGVVIGDTIRAYPFRALAETQGVIDEDLEGVPVTVWFDPGSRSAAAFDRRLGERTLTFERYAPGRFRDAETKSLWTMDGHCDGGLLKGKRLTPVFGLMSEWYGWYANHPGTSIWSP